MELCRLINATIVEESSPPDRNAPNGTSLTISSFTASSSRDRKSITTSFRGRSEEHGRQSGAVQ